MVAVVAAVRACCVLELRRRQAVLGTFIHLSYPLPAAAHQQQCDAAGAGTVQEIKAAQRARTGSALLPTWGRDFKRSR